MLQSSLQNDSLREQLPKTIDLSSPQLIEGSKMLINPASIRLVDSISRADQQRDSVNSELVEAQKPVLVNRPTVKRESFELHPILPITTNEIKLQTEVSGKPTIILPERNIGKNSPDWAIAIFIVGFALFATVRLLFEKYLSQLLLSSINYAASLRMFRERSVSLTHASTLLDAIFYLVFSLLSFQILEMANIHWFVSGFYMYLLILLGVVAFFNLKKVSYFLQGSISENLLESQEFIFNMNLYNRISGLFLLPICLVIAFTPLESPYVVAVVGIVAVLASYVLLILRGIKILLRKHFSIFYLILYLCTLEILPLLFIYKLVLV